MEEVADCAVETVVKADASVSGSVDGFGGAEPMAVVFLSLSVSKVPSEVEETVDGRSYTLQNGPL